MRQLFYCQMQQKFITKCVRLFITKCDSFVTKRNSYYKMRQLLQNVTFITNCDTTQVKATAANSFRISPMNQKYTVSTNAGSNSDLPCLKTSFSPASSKKMEIKKKKGNTKKLKVEKKVFRSKTKI